VPQALAGTGRRLAGTGWHWAPEAPSSPTSPVSSIALSALWAHVNWFEDGIESKKRATASPCGESEGGGTAALFLLQGVSFLNGGFITFLRNPCKGGGALQLQW